MPMRIAALFSTASAGIILGGCGANLPSLTTGSLFGGAQAAPTAAQNDEISRALGVSATSARAVKCGFNFDPARLKSQFISVETTSNPTDAAKLGQVYDSGFNGVTKAIATQENEYCTAARTARIKEALKRHLAGDYTPPPPRSRTRH
jgi:hypothetical protein